jgi:MFS family permease
LTARREYTLALLIGAVGSGLIWLALREQWAQAVFTQPKPLPQQTVGVTGSDLVPLAGALALAAFACLAAVIATRGVWRRAVGVLLTLFGAGAGAAVMTAVTAASVVSVAASHVGSPQSAAASGVAGSTTSGSSSSGAAVVIAGSAGHAVIGGASWRVVVIVGALMIFAAGLATVSRGADWPVMSSKYELPRARPPGAAGTGAASSSAASSSASEPSASEPESEAAPVGPRDSASMWESLSGGEDPTG